MNKEERQCQNCKSNFEITSEDEAFYRKINVPPPTFCPECREIRRIAFRNERSLYKRKCDLCGKMVVSRVSPDKPYPMYCNVCWHGDGWDSLSYGCDYDFSLPFFSQFRNLLFSVPHVALGAANNINSEWVNQETDDKNCYLNVGGHFNEDSAYNTYEIWGKNSFDNFWIIKSDFMYECTNCERGYKVVFSRDCFDCRESLFCSDCRNCSYCFGCAGLRNRQYCVFNRQYTKEGYEAFLSANPLTHHSIYMLSSEARDVWNCIPVRFASVFKSVDVSGNFVVESKHSSNVWNGEKIENSKHLYIAAMMKDSYDGSSIGWSELCYEASHTVGLYNGKFVAFSFGGKAESRQSSDLQYCIMTGTSNHCFGCVGVRNKEYCILNKQYTKEEYEALVPKIIAHMTENPYEGKNGRMYSYGESFPIEISPYGYNETVAMDYYPLLKKEAVQKGYPWSDYESDTKHEISDYQIPESITEVKDDVLEKTLKCEVTGKPYRIIPMELDFYRRMGLPIPRRAPLQRHKERMASFLPRKLFNRKCDCVGKMSSNEVYGNTKKHIHGDDECGAILKTPYSPKRPEVVYCDACYQAEIY